jgi:hypothetical protein
MGRSLGPFKPGMPEEEHPHGAGEARATAAGLPLARQVSYGPIQRKPRFVNCIPIYGFRLLALRAYKQGAS